MQYPQTEFAIKKDEGGASTIFWNPKLGKRALIEILAALECLGAFLDENGKPASFARIVSNFERPDIMIHLQNGNLSDAVSQLVFQINRCNKNNAAYQLERY